MPDYRTPKHEVAANDPNRDTTCPFCEAPAKTEIVDHTFQHGAVEIAVTLPVRQCADCNEEFVDYVGERIKTEAVYRAHGLLSPWDIRRIREQRGLSRPAFAEVTGLGEATIKRWETGATAQNRGYDRYLRLLGTAFGWAELKRLSAPSDSSSPAESSASASGIPVPGNRENPIRLRHLQVTENVRERQSSFRLMAA